MKKSFFPIICVDNFFDDPISIKKLALEYEFKQSPEGKYPGKRTEYLHKINPELFDFFNKKLFSIFYNFELESVNWIVSAHFQMINSYGDDRLNQGWIHLDDRALFAGVVYLNEYPNSSAGTSIYELKSGEEPDYDQTVKHKFYKNEITDIDFYLNALAENNRKFEKTVEFKNKFNRLIAFDGGSCFHKIDSFSNNDEPRLTLVFFVHEIQANRTPLS